MKNLWLIALIVWMQPLMAQDTAMVSLPGKFTNSDTGQRQTAAAMVAANAKLTGFNHKKLIVDGMAVGIYGGMLLWLNNEWYADYQRSPFHVFNDNGEWKQMDKAGHAWAVYSMSHIGYGLWRWSGYNNTQATLLSSGAGLAFMLGVEYLDGRSAEWGWSWGDAGADIFGAALFASQQLTWKEQRIRLKFSATPIDYPASVSGRAKDLFGTSLQNKLLKDYNAQTYWLSFPLPKDWHLPKWLRISVGYGAEGMLGAYHNLATDKQTGAVTFDRRDIPRYRQWYLAPDIDLTQIKTKSKFLRSVFYAVNIIKLPTPALEFSRGGFKGHLFHF